MKCTRVTTDCTGVPMPGRWSGAVSRSIVRRWVVVLAVALASVVLAAVQAPPQRIISLVPAATEILFAIGAGPRVIAVSSFDREPVEVARLPRVGALLDPDLERILALRPDLAVVYGTQHDLKQQLERAAIPMFDYRHGALADVTSTIRALGQRTGTATRADEVAAGIEAELDRIRARVAGRPRPRVLLVFGREAGTLRNLYASGGFGFLHDMVTIAGGANVFADQKRESVQASTETLLAIAPEVVIELRVDADGSDDLDAWKSLPALPAVRSGRLVVLRGSDLVTPGPRVASATERLARALHPDRF
jgi:iron complex transport system substrate-binding protein